MTNTDEPSRTLALITESDLAKMLSVSERHLENLRARRAIPFVRLGRSVRYEPAAVHAAIARLTVQTKH